MEVLKKFGKKLAKYKVVILILLCVGLFTKTFHQDGLLLYVGSKVVKLVGEKSGGTGFFVEAPSGKTYILTNRHVCETGDKTGTLTAKKEGSDVDHVVKIIKKSKIHDLCLVEPFGNTSGLSLANDIYPKERVYAVGHPDLEDLIISSGTFVSNTKINVVTKVNLTDPKECPGKLVPIRSMMIFSACIITYDASRIFLYIKGGSSGSPVVDFFGHIVAVVFAGDRNDHLKSYAVPLRFVKEFLKDF